MCPVAEELQMPTSYSNIAHPAPNPGPGQPLDSRGEESLAFSGAKWGPKVRTAGVCIPLIPCARTLETVQKGNQRVGNWPLSGQIFSHYCHSLPASLADCHESQHCHFRAERGICFSPNYPTSRASSPWRTSPSAEY